MPQEENSGLSGEFFDLLDRIEEEKEMTVSEKESEHLSMQDRLDKTYGDKEKEDPAWLDANDFFVDFKNAKDKGIKGELAESYKSLTRNFFVNPDPNYLENFFERLRVLISKMPNGEALMRIVEFGFLKMAEKFFKKENIGLENQPDKMMKWLELYSREKTFFSDFVAKLLKGSFESVGDDLKVFVGRLHSLAFGTLKSDDPKIIKNGVDILLFRTEIIGKEKDFYRYVATLFSLDDDILKLGLDIDSFLFVFGKFYSDKNFEEFKKNIDSYLQKWRLEKKDYFLELLQEPKSREEKRKVRGLALLHSLKDQRLIHDEGTHGMMNISDGVPFDPLKYPFNLITDPEKMTDFRKKYNRKLASVLSVRGGDDKFYLVAFSPKHGEGVVGLSKDHEERGNSMLDWFTGEKLVGKSFSNPEVFESVRLLFPDLTEEKEKQLEQRIKETKGKLIRDTNYFVNPSGDRIIVKDQFLLDRGIKEIFFKPHKSSLLDLDVFIRVGDVDCALHLDNSFNLRSIDDTKNALNLSVETSLIINELILSHLSDLLSDERQKAEVSEKNGNRKGLQSACFSRRPHRRKLPNGNSFDPAHAERVLEKYGINLWEMNKSAGFDRATGQYTYVQEVVSDEETGPVITAMDKSSILSEIF